MISQSPWSAAWKDFKQALSLSPAWLYIGWFDLVKRYRGSILGPFWLTITSAAFIVGLGPLYATLFGLKVEKYLPFLSIGIIMWSFISNTINESCLAYINSSHLMRAADLPKLFHIMNMLWKNVLIFLHNLPIIIIIYLLYGAELSWSLLMVIPGFVFVIFAMFNISILLAIICSRFRDVTQIVNSFLMLGFFFTPVIWHPSMQRAPSWVVDNNPLAGYIEFIRAPLLGVSISEHLVWVTIGSTIIIMLISFLVFAQSRAKIIFWV